MTTDALRLALEVIEKYGADADKPSVHLARALLAESARADELNSGLEALSREMMRMLPVYGAACRWADSPLHRGHRSPKSELELIKAIDAARSKP